MSTDNRGGRFKKSLVWKNSYDIEFTIDNASAVYTRLLGLCNGSSLIGVYLVNHGGSKEQVITPINIS